MTKLAVGLEFASIAIMEQFADYLFDYLINSLVYEMSKHNHNLLESKVTPQNA